MKRLLIIISILILLIGGYIYFTYPSFKETGQFWNPLSLLNFNSSSTSAAVQQKLSDAQEAVTNTAQSALDTASKAIEEKVEEGVNGVVNTVTQSAKNKLAEALGITPAGSGNSEGNALNLSICSTLKSRSVSYVIENPFSPPKDFSFRIDWGNGKTSQGSLRAADTRTTATHQYEKAGSYVNTFQIASGNESLTLQRKVCVE